VKGARGAGLEVLALNKTIRVFFRKNGRAKYISHLDLQRTMQRALKRAKLPVWETEGFNPHIYITFALPLSLGIESVCESFDIKIAEAISLDEIHKKLNETLTEELMIYEVAEPVYKHTEIQKAEYKIVVEGAKRFREFISQNEIVITKKTKKGEARVDLKPLTELKAAEENIIVLLLPAGGSLNINPMQVISAFGAFLGDELQAGITRTAIFCGDGKLFI
jgi:radical SAM-linked protein